jgi:hypothetical protein
VIAVIAVIGKAKILPLIHGTPGQVTLMALIFSDSIQSYRWTRAESERRG